MQTDLRDEVIETLAGLSKRCKSSGDRCASEALDYALISVFNAFFMDRKIDRSSAVTHPPVKETSKHQS